MPANLKEFQDKQALAGQLRMHYLDWGTEGKQHLLLLHGGSQSAHSWDEFSRTIRSEFHVIALDQRGHGDTDWSPKAIYTNTAHVRDIHRFVKQLGMKKFVLIGLSMGGSNAMAYAAIHPDFVDRLVIVDVGPELMERGRENIRRFKDDADILPSPADFVERAHRFNPLRPMDQLRERMFWHLRQLPDGRWTWKYDRRIGRRRQDPAAQWAYVRRIKAPTLLVRGAKSDILSPEAADRLHQTIPGSILKEVPDAGHTVAGDNPPGFYAAVKDFLDKTPRTS